MSAFRRAAVVLAWWLPCALPAQQPWTAVATPTTQTLWGIATNGSRFVAVGESGAIVYSDDATRWTAAQSGTTRWLVAVAHSSVCNLYVAVGDGGTILTSVDGASWSPQSSGTTQRLNSVLWGDDRFLVVGENGIALTSPNGHTWTPRTTGDTGWLRGVAYGNGRFVVTGHEGTLLVTTDGGITFQHGLIPTSNHLDAAIFTGDRFYVTGSDLVLGSSADGVIWILDPSLNADGSDNGIVYNGLVYFNNTLLAVGDRGRIRDQFGGTWNSSSITTDWRAVAATTYTVVAVGTSGQTAFTHIGSAGYHISLSGAPYVGRRVTLHADLTGQPATPFNSQWTLNGRPIAGATSDTLLIEAAALTDIGSYYFTSSVANGSVRGSFALNLYPGPPSADLVDSTFSPSLNAGVETLAPLADGRLYVAGRGLTFTVNGRTQSGLARLNADGTVDPTFNCGAGLVLGFNTPFLYLQSDGRLVVWAKFTRVGGTFATPLARYRPDGSLDPSFTPDASLRDTEDLPILLADDRWLTATAQTNTAGNRVLALARFSANGAIDAAFAPQVATASFAAPTNQTRTAVVTTVDPQGRVYLGMHYGLASTFSYVAFNNRTALLRLSADGTPDAAFACRSFDELRTLQAAPQGIIVKEVTWAWSRPSYQKWTEKTKRLRFDGSDDPTFSPIVTDLSPGGDLTMSSFGSLAVLADGSLAMSSRTARARRGLVRFDATGAFDPDFSAELGNDAYLGYRATLVALPQGQFLLVGDFATFQGERHPYLVRLTPDRHGGVTHLANLSVRSDTSAPGGSDTLILGYVTTGGDTSVLARAAGPALDTFGVKDLLPDPQLGLFSGPVLVSSNDDWGTGPAALLAATATRLGAFPFPNGSRDAALYTTAPAGACTLQISGKNAASGVALAELYDATAAPTGFKSPRLTNFSVRANTGSGNSTLIAGLTIGGNSARNYLIRAAGPALAAFGVASFLRDPVLTIFRGTTAIFRNDNWGSSINPGAGLEDHATVLEATRIVGAFPFANGSKDAALVISLLPGLYTAQVTSGDGTAGVTLVEVYEIP